MKTGEKYNLSEIELRVLRLIVKGKNENEIKEALNTGEDEIKTHISSIYKKLNTTNNIKTAIKAVKEYLV